MSKQNENAQVRTGTIIRTNKRETSFVMIDKFGLESDDLSFKAKGILAYLLSKPDDWQIYESDLVKHSKDGRDSVRAGLKELEKAGYLTRKQLRNERGVFKQMEYMVYERPIEVENEETQEVEPQTDFPSSDNPTPDKPTLLIKNLSNNDLNKNDIKKECMNEQDSNESVLQPSEKEKTKTKKVEVSQELSQAIYGALREQALGKCYIASHVPMDEKTIGTIFVRLIKKYPTKLHPEVIKIACEEYDFQTDPDIFGELKTTPKTAVGFFLAIYEESLIAWEAERSFKSMQYNR